MKRLFLCFLACAATANLRSEAFSGYILAANRTNIAEVIDASTLETVARIRFDFRVERISGAGPLQLTVAGYTDGAACCTEYTLDLGTLRLTPRAPSTARDNFGPPIMSPDGRWGAGIRNFRGPALRMVDRTTGVGHDLIPTGLSLSEEVCGGNWAAQGTWSGDRFYLYVACPHHSGLLWSVAPEATELGTEVQVDPFNQLPDCRHPLPVARGLIAVGTELFLYETAGSKGSRSCPVDAPGGLWMLDPLTGRLHDPIAQNLYFGEMQADRSGALLFGVVHAHLNSLGAAQLVAINPHNGKIAKSRDIQGGVLNISLATLGVVRGGDLKAVSPD